MGMQPGERGLREAESRDRNVIIVCRTAVARLACPSLPFLNLYHHKLRS